LTEAEWLAATDPLPMLDFLRGRVSDRKRRLFAVSCCRRVGELHEPWMVAALLAAERYADGHCSRGELDAFRRQAEGSLSEIDGDLEEVVCVSIWRATDLDREEEVERDDFAAVSAAHVVFAVEDPQDERRVQAAIAKEVFGNPFRPAVLDPRLRTANVLSLAQGVYQSRVFYRLPVLADALEDAGCADADLLGHLRGPGPHVRGCWGLDSVLGKE
jgi:hypothetical protein